VNIGDWIMWSGVAIMGLMVVLAIGVLVVNMWEDGDKVAAVLVALFALSIAMLIGGGTYSDSLTKRVSEQGEPR
jgi:hypothetical protein